jgi:hypothetical protein
VATTRPSENFGWVLAIIGVFLFLVCLQTAG